MKPIISVENLSKQYRIGTKLPYKTFRETLMNAITSPARLFRHSEQRAKGKEQSAMPSALRSMPLSEDGYIRVLKDVSFEVKEGKFSASLAILNPKLAWQTEYIGVQIDNKVKG